MKNIKFGFSFICGVILVALTSCLGSDESEEYFTTSAEILTFSVSHEKITALDSVIFHIDQVFEQGNDSITGHIYNKDSVRYGVNPGNYRLSVKYTAGGYGFYNMVMDESGNIKDSVWINPGDTLDFSKPLLLKSYAADMKKFKIYKAELNFAKTDPDSIQYKQIASNLNFLNAPESKTIGFNQQFYTYSQPAAVVVLNTSTDGKSWQSESLTGFPDNAVLASITESNGKLYLISQNNKMYVSPDARSWTEIPVAYPVVTLMGAIQPGTMLSQLLSCVVKHDETLYFATTLGDGQFVLGNAVPSDFPAQGFASLSFERMQMHYLLVVGGQTGSGVIKNAVWSTENGLYWTLISEKNEAGRFPAMTGANVLKYGQDGNLLLFNGKLSGGSFNKEVYQSKDNGIYWQKLPNKYKFPATYSNRYNASAVLGDKNIFYIFGGKQVNPVTDCWSGRQNKMIVD